MKLLDWQIFSNLSIQKLHHFDQTLDVSNRKSSTAMLPLCIAYYNAERMIQNMHRLIFATNTINGRILTYQQFFKFLFQEGILEQNIAP
ncbi:hypothetical protein EHS13_09480 [Paenibacillus psychroresistens]|uniref:Uncharacterized protein n=1 Tax=Paenibacillus psychroresistens TaxID=1778678 RepID=A0A6B8RIC0_9BACL|nr:hypothetical protein EHS13_09480 [Paenibacillus psychroresistens]